MVDNHLEPCPFCGCEDAAKATSRQAITAWNTRHPHTDKPERK